MISWSSSNQGTQISAKTWPLTCGGAVGCSTAVGVQQQHMSMITMDRMHIKVKILSCIYLSEWTYQTTYALNHLVKIKQNKEHPLLNMILIYDIVLPARKSYFYWLTDDFVALNDVIKCVTHACIQHFGPRLWWDCLRGRCVASKEGQQLVCR